jgi:WD40 repeat protein
MTTRRWMLVVAGVAFAVALWRADFLAHRWQSVCSVTFSPDGQTVAAGMYSGKSFNEDYHFCIGDIGQTITLFAADTGSSRGVLEDSRYQGTSRGLPSTPLGQFLGFSPDGRTLAAGNWDGTVKLWSPKTRQLIGVLGPTCQRVAAVCFSGDGLKLAAGCRDLATLWDTAAYGPGSQIGTATTDARSIALSADSKAIAVGGQFSIGGVQVWVVNGGRRKTTVPITGEGVLALQFGSNGRFLAIGGAETALLWDLVECRTRFEVAGPWTVAVALSPDCGTLATAGTDGLRFWKTATGEPAGAFRSLRWIRSLAYSPNGRLPAAGDDLGYITVWDTSSGASSGPPAFRHLGR